MNFRIRRAHARDREVLAALFAQFIAEQAAWGAQFRARAGAHPEHAQLFDRAFKNSEATRDDETLLLIAEPAATPSPPAPKPRETDARDATVTATPVVAEPRASATVTAVAATANSARAAVTDARAATAVATPAAANSARVDAASSADARDATTAVAFLLARVETRPAFFVETRRVRVDELFVRPSARRRGLGRALFARAQAWARAHGAARLVLQVAHANADARAFYHALGFAPFMEFLEREL